MTFKTDLRPDAWIVVADGARARIFEEPLRLGALKPVREIAADPKARHRSKAGGTVHDRAGGGRHGVREGSPADAAEQKFLAEVADIVREAAIARKYERLVLIAPPKALGALRAGLGPAAELVELADAHDRTHETTEEIRDRLRSLRIPG